jgi:hypothetical protein
VNAGEKSEREREGEKKKEKKKEGIRPRKMLDVSFFS